MRPICIFLLTLPFVLVRAQENHLDVEGHVKIRGNIDINHIDDTSSVYIGRNAGVNAASSDRGNTFVGANSGANNLSAFRNSFFGNRAGEKNTSGNLNSFFGYVAGENNFDGYDNSFFGSRAGENNLGGFLNCSFGVEAGADNKEGSRNVAIGSEAGVRDTAMNNSVYIGFGAGHLSEFGSRSGNVFIGYLAGQDEMNSNRLYIENSNADSANALIYGEFDNDLLKVNGALHVMGTSGGDGNIVLDNKGDISFITNGGDEKAVLTLHSDNHTYLDAEEDLIFRTGGISIGMRVEADGDVLINDLAGAGTADVQVDANGQLMRAPSDLRLKEDIHTIDGALQKVIGLRGVSYNWKGRPNPNKTLGVIAQEVLEVVPEVVNSDGEYYGVNYSQLPALLIEAIKEQQEQIEIIKALQNQLESQQQVQNENHQLKVQIGEIADRLAKLESRL